MADWVTLSMFKITFTGIVLAHDKWVAYSNL